VGHHIHTPPILGAAGDLTAPPAQLMHQPTWHPTGIGSAQAPPTRQQSHEVDPRAALLPIRWSQRVNWSQTFSWWRVIFLRLERETILI
jgi:hypothetical protein